ncbi:MAG: type II secretion system major pseudopilin GspG [Spirochaetia bacterium]
MERKTMGQIEKERCFPNKEDRKQGFTFVETIIVIGIILILTSTVGVIAFRYLGRAKSVTARNNIQTYSLALNTYLLDTGMLPTEEQGLEALWERPVLEPVPENWQGPYVDRAVGPDPWGNEYEYTVPGPHGLPFGIQSYGADGLPGGEGENADIQSWQN